MHSPEPMIDGITCCHRHFPTLFYSPLSPSSADSAAHFDYIQVFPMMSFAFVLADIIGPHDLPVGRVSYVIVPTLPFLHFPACSLFFQNVLLLYRMRYCSYQIGTSCSSI